VADAFLAGDDPNWPTGSEQNLWIGRSSGGNENRSIYRFSLGMIPQGSTITSATLMVWLSSSIHTATITVHPLLQPWNEATVNGANYGNPAFFDQAIAGSFIASGDGGYKLVDVKDLVAAWVSGVRPNFGVGLTEPPIGTHHTFSSESPSMGVRPKLNVCYFACGQ
jgi:hypothetical protein